MTSGKSNRTPNAPGLRLLKTLTGDKGLFNEVSWSPSGHAVAIASSDGCVYYWELEGDQILKKLDCCNNQIFSIAWSKDSRYFISSSASGALYIWKRNTLRFSQLHSGFGSIIWKICFHPTKNIVATVSDDGSIRIIDPESGEMLDSYLNDARQIFCAEWSPDGKYLACGCVDGSVVIVNFKTRAIQNIIKCDDTPVRSLAWHPSTQNLLSGSNTGRIEYWDIESEQRLASLEGHTGMVYDLGFSSDGRLLISKSDDNSVRVWDFNRLKLITHLQNVASGIQLTGGIDFNEKKSLVAIRSEHDRAVCIWEYDLTTLLTDIGAIETHHYCNAKVVLMGDSGVGKSGLNLVLSGQKFEPTESTHGRKITLLEHYQVLLSKDNIEIRETLLWDLAGQRNYNLIHQLHFNEVNVAVIVFDPSMENDNFSGVRRWLQALSYSTQTDQYSKIKKLLVAARVDRGGINVTNEKISEAASEMGFDGFFETSAKEGFQISRLIDAIHNSIDWDQLARTSSTNIFHKIKTFLRLESQEGVVITTDDSLLNSFRKSHKELENIHDLKDIFQTCIALVGSRGLIRRLSFGGLILLQPQKLDSYASSIIQAARAEKQGLGSVLEEEIFSGNFYIPKDERIVDRGMEKLLLIATVEELKKHEIALKEDGFLVFPSEFTRELESIEDIHDKAIVFQFKGALERVYATLVVKLCKGGPFKQKQLWKNAAVFYLDFGGTFSIFLRETTHGLGELSLVFDKQTNITTQILFEGYVATHLEKCESVNRIKIYMCSECSTEISKEQVSKRKRLGHYSLSCPVCENQIDLVDPTKDGVLNDEVKAQHFAIDNRAKIEQLKSQVSTVLLGKVATSDYDVFLSYSRKDEKKVSQISNQLMERGILPWLDIKDLRPGSSWINEIEEVLSNIAVAVVFLSSDRNGESWAKMEIKALLRLCVEKQIRVIPALLEGEKTDEGTSIFLEEYHRIDFRTPFPNPLDQLVWGITGNKSR